MSDHRVKDELLRLLSQKDNSYPQAFVDSLKLHALVFSSDMQYPQHTEEVALCLESFIISSDLIDDIQDSEPHMKSLSEMEFGSTLNSAITLLMLTLTKLNENVPHELYQTTLHLLLKAMEGQYLDVNNSCETIEQYIEMVKLKSGSIIALANVLGAGLSSSNQLNTIVSYSLCLGASAQIANDMKDVFNFDTKSDWKLKRKTLPILYMLNPDFEEAGFIRAYYEGNISYEQFYEKRDVVMDLLGRLGAIPFSNYYKIKFDKEAINLINQLVIDDDQKSLLINKLLM